MFQQREAWWDLLCVLDLPNNSGFIYSAEEKRADESLSSKNLHGTTGAHSSKLNLSAGEDTPHYSLDNKFILGVMSGIQANLGEDWVRQQFFDYTCTLLNLAQDSQNGLQESRMNDKTRKFWEANQSRIAMLEGTAEYKAMPSHLWMWAIDNDDVPAAEPVSDKNISESSEYSAVNQIFPESGEGVKLDDAAGLRLKGYIQKLRQEICFDSMTEIEMYYQQLEKYLHSEVSLQAMLVLLPESQGGLTPFAAGLFHISPVVRYCTVLILDRIQTFPSTAPAFQALNKFVLFAYRRQKSKLEDYTLLQELRDRAAQILVGTKEGDNSLTNTGTAADASGSVVDESSSSFSTFFQQTIALLNVPGNSAHEDRDSSGVGISLDLIP